MLGFGNSSLCLMYVSYSRVCLFVGFFFFLSLQSYIWFLVVMLQSLVGSCIYQSSTQNTDICLHLIFYRMNLVNKNDTCHIIKKTIVHPL